MAEHRQINGKDCVAMFGDNGGRIGFPPFNDEEYFRAASMLIDQLKHGDRYTENGGRPYVHPVGYDQSFCYGTEYDQRVIDRMISEGILELEVFRPNTYSKYFIAKILKPLEGPVKAMAD